MSCAEEEDAYVPKPRGFHRIVLPEHDYKPLNGPYPYTFEYSRHAKVVPDTSFMTEPYWIEVVYPAFEATLSVAYKEVDNNLDSLAEMMNDSHRLTNKHHVRAYAIDEYVVKTPNGMSAVVFEIEGDVPSYFQYYLTDSTDHFLRVALYFPTSSKADSLAPVIEYVKKDMLHMVNSTKWRPLR